MQIFYQKLIACFLHRNFIKLMRFPLAVILLIQFFFVASASNGQTIRTTRISLNAENITLKQAFEQIEAKTNFTIAYNATVLNTSKTVRLTIKNETIEAILHRLLDGYKGLISQVDDTHILIKVTPQPQPIVKKAFQQSGAVKGRIVEFETAAPLPGASVRIMELANKGTSSDAGGYYTLAGIPAGKYTLQVTFIGFKTEQLQVEVKEGKDAIYDVKLQGSNALQEVVVQSRQALTRKPVAYTSDRELIKEVKAAGAVVSGISNEQIIKSADRNAAEVVKRIPGVTVTDERFIVVRGMNQRYNQTYLNGNIAPSTELYSRAFAYDLLPSPIIDRILIYKSPTPDLFGDMAGGSVKIFTKNTRPVRHFDIGIQTAYRQGSTFKDALNYQGGKLDWLGFDDGTRKLSAAIPSFSEAYGKTNIAQQKYVNAFSKDLKPGTIKLNPDMQLFANYFDNFKIGKARVYNFTFVNYTAENRSREIYQQTGNLFSRSFDQLAERNNITNSASTVQMGRINVMESLKLKLNDRNSIEFSNFFLNEGRKNTSSAVTRPNELPEQDSSTMFRSKEILESFEQRTLYSGNLNGDHVAGKTKNQHLQWNLGYNYYKQNVPDQRGIRFEGQNGALYSAGSNTNDYTNNFLGMINRLYINSNEQNYNGSVDYSYTFNPILTLKAGTYQLFKNRDVDRRFFKVGRAGLEGVNITPSSPSGIYDNYGYSNPNLIRFTPEQLGQVWSDNYFTSDGRGLAVYDATQPTDSYAANERNSTFYLMGNASFLHKKLNIIGGVRVENDEQQLSAAVLSGGGLFTPILLKKPRTSWLPSVNATYAMNDTTFIIRGGYGKTVNRPEFREISPFNDYDFLNNEQIIGNPNLVTADIDNYDLRLEHYPRNNENELISIGGFYKKLKNPIERIRRSLSAFADADGNFTNISFQNADQAVVYGAEVEIRKSLSFIPGNIFRNLSVVFNGSLIHSEASKKETTATSSDSEFKNRPLQGQAPYVLNTGLFYENPSSGTKASLMYNVSGPTIYAISVNSTAESTGGATGSIGQKIIRPNLLEVPVNLLDFSLTQRLYKALNARLNVQNLLNNRSYKIVEDQNYDQKYTPENPVQATTTGGQQRTAYKGDNIFRTYNNGRYFILSFTYSF